MQISGAAGHYTHKLLHRRASPRPSCSLSCSYSWGGVITDLEPLFFVQHASLDTLVSNLSNCFFGCFLLFLTENLALSSLCCHLWVALRNQIVEAWSHTPVCLAPRAHCRIVTLGGDVLIRCDNLPRTYTLPYKDTQQQQADRSHKQVIQRTDTQQNTLQLLRLLTHSDQYSQSVFTTESAKWYNISFPNATTNLLH